MHINWNMGDRVIYLHYPGRVCNVDTKFNKALIWFDDGNKRWICNSKLTRLAE